MKGCSKLLSLLTRPFHQSAPNGVLSGDLVWGLGRGSHGVSEGNRVGMCPFAKKKSVTMICDSACCRDGGSEFLQRQGALAKPSC